MDARARRKRRQLSAASYYISDIDPYSNPYSSTEFLTYPSGSYYSAPDYGYPNTGYSGDRPFDPNYYANNLNQYASSYSSNNYNQYPYGTGQVYEYPTLGSAYGSGLYGPYGSLLNSYAPTGFNVRYPNWQQGNIDQYYTGGTGSGLSDTGYYWYRSPRRVPPQSRSGKIPDGNIGRQNAAIRSGKSASPNSRVKRRIEKRPSI